MLKQIAKWELLELDFKIPKTHNNPFWDVELCFCFENRGKKCFIDGFYDGDCDKNELYKVRFSPMDEGMWTWKCNSNCKELDGLTGKFECMAAISHGGLSPNHAFPNWFFHQDKTPAHIVNDGWYPHPMFGDTLPFEELETGCPTEQEMNTYFDSMSDYGVNMTIEVDQLYARSGFLDDPSFNWPWQPIEGKLGQIDKDRFNLQYYRRMEQTLIECQKRGIFFWMELLFDNSVFRPREWGFHPVNRKNGGWLRGNNAGSCMPDFMRMDNPEHMNYIGKYLSYTIARLSAYRNICWQIGAENGNIAPQHKDLIVPWYKHWGRYISVKDPHARIQSFGDVGKIPGYVDSARNHVVITQEHTSMKDEKAYCEAIHNFSIKFWDYARPCIVGEQDRHNCGYFDAERKGYWTAFVSGIYMGRVDRHFRMAQKEMLYESRLFCEDKTPPIYEQLAHMRNFMEKSGVKYWQMEPISVADYYNSKYIYGMAEASEQYLFYFVDGGFIELDAPACKMFWFNPRTGEFSKTIELSAGNIKFEAPGSDDWVLYVQKRKGSV